MFQAVVISLLWTCVKNWAEGDGTTILVGRRLWLNYLVLSHLSYFEESYRPLGQPLKVLILCHFT